MTLNNYEYQKDKTKNIWKDVFSTQSINFPNVTSLAKLILLIPPNSYACERDNYEIIMLI